jgi:hypothetical protein
VRLREVGDPQLRLLRQLASRISTRLEAEFTEPVEAESSSIGVSLRERGHSVSMELPEALLLQAVSQPTAREAMRVRIKATRDRMLFRAPPAPLPKSIAPAADPAFSRGGFGRGGFGQGRGRR